MQPLLLDEDVLTQGETLPTGKQTCMEEEYNFIMTNYQPEQFPEPEHISLVGEEYETQQGLQRIMLESYSEENVDEIFAIIDSNRDHFTTYDENWVEKYRTKEDLLDGIYNPKPNIHRFLIRNASGDPIGITRLEVNKDDASHASVGYDIDYSYTKSGYATQVLRLLVSYAANEFNITTLHANVDPNNQGSIKVLEKNGFRRIGKSDPASRFEQYQREV